MHTKRVLVVLMLALALLVSACSPSGGKEGETPSATGHLDPKKPVTVALWHYYVGENQQALETAVSDFNQTVGMDSGVIVEAVAMGSISELEQSITDSAMGVINAKPMPQLFSSYPDKALEIDALEMIVDLNDYITEEEKAQYVADFLYDGIFEGGRLLMLPIVKSTELMYLNTTGWDPFAQANDIDTTALSTWESLYETAKAYYWWTAGDRTAGDEGASWSGTALMGFDSVANYVISGCKQLGVNVIDASAGEAGEAVLHRDALRRVFEPYFKGMSLGYYAAVGKFRSDDIKAGNLIAYVGSSSSAAYFPTWIEKDNTQMPIDFQPLSLPVFEGGEAYAIQQGAGMCVAKSTPAQQEGAALFLKWFTDSEQNIRFAMTTGYLPVKTQAYDSELFEEVLASLRGGDQTEKNVAGVYEIALAQITQSNTYAATPFVGSYDVRTILQSTLIESAQAGLAATAAYQAEGLSEEEILQRLDVDAQFEAWLAAIQTALEALEIAYTVV